MKITLSLILLVATANFSFSQASKAKPITKPTFALLYINNNNQVCVYGKHKSGTNVSLINLNEKKIINYKTKNSLSEINNDLGEKIQYTVLDNPPPIEELDNFERTAILNGVGRDFEIITSVESNDLIQISLMDSLIKSQNMLAKTLKINAELTDLNEYLEALKDTKPFVQKVTTGSFSFEIIQYPSPATKEGNGPVYIWQNGKIKQLSGQCSRPILVYKYDGNFYLNSSSSCCECGLSAEETFQINKSNFKIVFSDYSYST